MKVLERAAVPGTSGVYEVHKVSGVKDYPFRVWSNCRDIYLQDTTRFGSNTTKPTSTYGVKFDTGELADVQTKVHLKKLVQMVGWE